MSRPRARRLDPARPRRPSRGADAVIFAVDVGVRDRHRFAGKPVVSSGVKRPFDQADEMIAEALRYADDPNAPRVEGDGRRRPEQPTGAPASPGAPRPPGADDRCLLHDPVRRGGRSADRARLPVRRLRDRRPGRRRSSSTTTLFNLPDPALSASTTRLFDSGFFAYFGAVFFVLGATAFKFLVPGAGRLHRLRHRRPAGHRPGLRHGRASPSTSAASASRERLPRRHHRRRPRRLHGPVDLHAGRSRPGCVA